MANKKEEYYKGVTFLNFQSGSEDEPSEKLLKLISKFVVEMQEHKIRVYTNVQVGTPPPPPGGGHPG